MFFRTAMQVLIIKGSTLPPLATVHTWRLLKMPDLKERFLSKGKKSEIFLQDPKVTVHFEKCRGVIDEKK